MITKFVSPFTFCCSSKISHSKFARTVHCNTCLFVTNSSGLRGFSSIRSFLVDFSVVGNHCMSTVQSVHLYCICQNNAQPIFFFVASAKNAHLLKYFMQLRCQNYIQGETDFKTRSNLILYCPNKIIVLVVQFCPVAIRKWRLLLLRWFSSVPCQPKNGG